MLISYSCNLFSSVLSTSQSFFVSTDFSPVKLMYIYDTPALCVPRVTPNKSQTRYVPSGTSPPPLWNHLFGFHNRGSYGTPLSSGTDRFWNRKWVPDQGGVVPDVPGMCPLADLTNIQPTFQHGVVAFVPRHTRLESSHHTHYS